MNKNSNNLCDSPEQIYGEAKLNKKEQSLDENKINEIRIYSGAKYQNAQEVDCRRNR